MPKRKKIRDYGNIIRPSFEEQYINKWSNNQEKKSDLKMASLLLLAEGGSLVQIIVCEDDMYNGIYHLRHFKYDDRKEPILVVDDLDDIHNAKSQEFEALIGQLSELSLKYDIILPEDLDLETNPLDMFDQLDKLLMG